LKLLALAPGAERSRCELLVLLGHLWRCKRSVDGSDVQVSVRTDDPPTVGWRLLEQGPAVSGASRSAARVGYQPSVAPPWVG